MTVYVVRFDHSEAGQGIEGVYDRLYDAQQAVRDAHAACHPDEDVPAIQVTYTYGEGDDYTEVYEDEDGLMGNIWVISYHKVEGR